MSILVIDTETTGMDENEDRIVEIAGVRIRNGEIVYARDSLVNPGRPIPVQASAIHHLTDADVVDARSLDEALDYLGVASDDVLVAHNSGFDSKFLPSLAQHKWVCTWKCANKLIPDAPAFGNQVLRYYLGLSVDVGNGRDGLPHSAGFDARVTAQLMLHLLALSSIEELIEISSDPVLLKKMPFGKHRGLPFPEVPKDYRVWLRGRPDLDRDLKHTLDHYA